jgi:hypothetical protein
MLNEIQTNLFIAILRMITQRDKLLRYTECAVSLRDAAQEERRAFTFTGHIPEDLNPQLQRCKHIVSRSKARKRIN